MTSESALASRTLAGAFACLLPTVSSSQDAEANKALARRFYENVWFSNNPGVVDEIVAPEYVIHDVGGVDGLREPARGVPRRRHPCTPVRMESTALACSAKAGDSVTRDA